jgi:hypothetical protein
MLLWIAGCDSGRELPDPGPSLGLDTSATIPSLSASQVTTLCDWVAGRVGRWGETVHCGSATVTSPPSEATCVTEFQSEPATCAITVGQLQDCTNAVLSGPCQSGATPAACADLFATGFASSCN